MRGAHVFGYMHGQHYIIVGLKGRTAKMQSELKVDHTSLMSTQIMPLGDVLVLIITGFLR